MMKGCVAGGRPSAVDISWIGYDIDDKNNQIS
jgi:hypothetical protein